MNIRSLFLPVIACPDPVKIVNATHSVKKGLRLRTVVYKCLPGFDHITGNKMRTCLPNGTWTGADIECKGTCLNDEHYSVLSHNTFQ